jgi:hypothetical protein
MFEDEKLVEILRALPKFVQVRVSNVLFYQNVCTLDSLLSLRPADLLNAKSMGRRSLAALEEALAAKDLCLLDGNRRAGEKPTEFELHVGSAVAIIYRRAVSLEQAFRGKRDEDIPTLAKEIRHAANRLLRFLDEKNHGRSRRRRSGR